MKDKDNNRKYSTLGIAIMVANENNLTLMQNSQQPWGV